MKAVAQKLSPLFGSDVSYRIPLFQRPYAWGEERQWQPLWADVQRIAGQLLSLSEEEKKKFPSHFMGAIVLQEQSANSGEVVKRIVVDGQQRLTTLQILIRAAQESFRGLGEIELSDQMSHLLLNKSDYLAGDLENETKVRQSNSNDRHAFRDVIIESGDNSPSRGIGQCYQYFKDAIGRWLNENPDCRSIKCKALGEVITSHLQLAVVDLDPGERPHYIFSVLNARAEPLKESDHIKNTVMYEAGVIDDAEKARRLWGVFDSDEWWRGDTKEGRITRIHLDRFLNYWVLMKQGREINANRVSVEFTSHFDSIRPKYDTSQLAMEELTKGLAASGLVYKDLEEARYPGIEVSLQRIKIMEAGVAMPILLWLFSENRPRDERIRGVRALESYLVRRMLCNFGTQGLNRLFIELIGELNSSGGASPGQTIVEFLRNQTVENRMWPHDQAIKDALIGVPMRATLGRQIMVLQAIESHLRTDRSEPFRPGPLTLEHIMPTKYEKNWPLPLLATEEDEEKRKNAIREIGNLTLVSGKLNSTLSNSEWTQKRGALSKHTALRLNWELLQDNPHTWDEDSIKARSHQLVDAIAQIWKAADQI